jgi:hypothetical protein
VAAPCVAGGPTVGAGHRTFGKNRLAVVKFSPAAGGSSREAIDRHLLGFNHLLSSSMPHSMPHAAIRRRGGAGVGEMGMRDKA